MVAEAEARRARDANLESVAAFERLDSFIASTLAEGETAEGGSAAPPLRSPLRNGSHSPADPARNGSRSGRIRAAGRDASGMGCGGGRDGMATPPPSARHVTGPLRSRDRPEGLLNGGSACEVGADGAAGSSVSSSAGHSAGGRCASASCNGWDASTPGHRTPAGRVGLGGGLYGAGSRLTNGCGGSGGGMIGGVGCDDGDGGAELSSAERAALLEQGRKRFQELRSSRGSRGSRGIGTTTNPAATIHTGHVIHSDLLDPPPGASPQSSSGRALSRQAMCAVPSWRQRITISSASLAPPPPPRSKRHFTSLRSSSTRTSARRPWPRKRSSGWRRHTERSLTAS
mmetsp:Transcript_46001/g.103643  ORF Transcript_46001/g.103643 Transcript_46001/m.103643 type:complete len:343 (+) Transcript_46001:626-1654(+)